MKGEVYQSTGAWYLIKGEDGQFTKGRLRGKLKLDDKKVTNPIAVGDVVEYKLESTDEDQPVNIISVMPRKNYMIRKSPRKTAHSHIVAANLDQAAIVFTLKLPRTSRGFLDRYLLCAQAYNIEGLVFVNKIDLLNESEREEAEVIKLIYSHIGYKTYLFSLETGEGLADIREVLKGKKTLISGHSGVGKSTLLNNLNPELDVRVSNISKFSKKGTHTTTFATTYDLDAETSVIDTPGIKEFGIEDLEPYEISQFFPDIKPYAEQCRFNTCSHTHEPGCSVIEALENAKIDPDRYKSYLSIIDDEETHR